jgi:hypothetical protein
MGKTHARGQRPRELEARAALAVLVWRALGPGIPIICVEGHDLPDTDRSGAQVVEALAVAAGVRADDLVVRSVSNCTAREVEAVRDILRERDLQHPLVLTHPYHAWRTRWYFSGVGVRARVVGCSPREAARWARKPESGPLSAAIAGGESPWWNRLREGCVEAALYLLHGLDRRGRLERRLADRLRKSRAA